VGCLQTIKYATEAKAEGASYKFSLKKRAACFRAYVTSCCSYEKCVEDLLYSHQFWAEETVDGGEVPSEAELANWVLQFGQAEYEQLCKASATAEL
jgi:hypothetical protein